MVRSDSGISSPSLMESGKKRVRRKNTQDLIIHELKLVMKLGMNKLQIADEKEGASLGGVILDSGWLVKFKIKKQRVGLLMVEGG